MTETQRMFTVQKQSGVISPRAYCAEKVEDLLQEFNNPFPFLLSFLFLENNRVPDPGNLNDTHFMCTCFPEVGGWEFDIEVLCLR